MKNIKNNGHETKQGVWSTWCTHYGNEGWKRALGELIDNAILALIGYFKKISIELKNGRLVIKDTGIGFASLDGIYAAFDYNIKNKFQKGLNNLFATGMKSALAFCHPADAKHFILYSRTQDGNMFKVTGDIVNDKFIIYANPIKTWKFGKYNTVFQTTVDKDVFPNENVVKTYITEIAWSAIHNYNCIIEFNGEVVNEFCPGKVIKTDVVTIGERTIIYITFDVDDPNYTRNEKHGFYIYAAGCFVQHAGSDILPKVVKTGERNEYNHLITLVEVIPNNKNAMLSVTSDKREVLWNSEETFRKELVKTCGKPYSDAHAVYLKSTKACQEEIEPTLAKKFGDTSSVAYGVKLSEEIADIKFHAVLFKVKKADKALVEEICAQTNVTLNDIICDNQKVAALISIEPMRTVSCACIKNALGSLAAFEACYGYKPMVYIVGKSINANANKMLSVVSGVEFLNKI